MSYHLAALVTVLRRSLRQTPSLSGLCATVSNVAPQTHHAFSLRQICDLRERQLHDAPRSAVWPRGVTNGITKG